MPSKKFEERLAEQRKAALLPDVFLTRFQHVERLGNEEVEGLLDGDVIVETKVDGACLTVAHYEQHGIVIASRNNVVYKDGDYVKFPKLNEDGTPQLDEQGNPKFETRFEDAVEHILHRDGILTLIYSGWILRGEWMLKHSVLYRADVYQNLLIFDVEDHQGNYIHPDSWMPKCDELNVKYIPVLARLSKPTVDQLVELTKGPDEFGAPQKEGIVVKRYVDWANKYGQATWGKIISKDFEEKNRLTFGARADDPSELRFVAGTITESFILKTIDTIADKNGRKLTVRDMPEVLGRVWHDAFTEELWNFVKEESVSKFDFKVARRLAEKKTRDVALAFFNGILSIFQEDRT